MLLCPRGRCGCVRHGEPAARALRARTGVEVEVIPGITAACSGGAVLGSPLTCDFACISLSDLLTPWGKIEQRLRGAAAGDFCIALYKSVEQKTHRPSAPCLRYSAGDRAAETVCGLVRSIGREGEHFSLTTLGELRDTPVDMLTTVFVGNSRTLVMDGRMVNAEGVSRRMKLMFSPARQKDMICAGFLSKTTIRRRFLLQQSMVRR